MNTCEKIGLNNPVKSTREGKKLMVCARDRYTDKIKLIHFGSSDYQDYTQHHDKERRKNYLTRSAGIRDGKGRLTKDNPGSPNYWARRVLWPQRK